MKIIANDGKEFPTVEECLRYEKQMETKKKIYDSTEFVFYRLRKEEMEDIVLLVHAKENHNVIASFLAQTLYGNRITAPEYLAEEGFRSGAICFQWMLKLMTKEEIMTIGKEAVESGQAMVFETKDVTRIFEKNSDFRKRQPDEKEPDRKKDEMIDVYRFIPSLASYVRMTIRRADKQDGDLEVLIPEGTMGCLKLSGRIDYEDMMVYRLHGHLMSTLLGN